MHSEKVQVKIFASGPADVHAYVPVFHRFIRDAVLKDELLIDVVDYSHVKDGPDLVLIGHGSDYGLDRGGGELGLLYASKREPAVDEGPFVPALRRALRAALVLEKEPVAGQKLAFRSDTLLVRIADRLRAPNDDATLARFLPELRAALTRLYADTPVTLERVGDERELFGVQVRAASAPALSVLLERLG